MRVDPARQIASGVIMATVRWYFKKRRISFPYPHPTYSSVIPHHGCQWTSLPTRKPIEKEESQDRNRKAMGNMPKAQIPRLEKRGLPLGI
jgi:hypothetical protein